MSKTFQTIGLAVLIAATIGVTAGVLNGWMIGHWEDFILEQHERVLDVPGGIKRYTWLRTAHFALPLALGGMVAMAICKRFTNITGWRIVIPLAGGALLGWFSAQMVGGMVGERWSEVGSSVFVPALLFAVVPIIKIAKDELL